MNTLIAKQKEVLRTELKQRRNAIPADAKTRAGQHIANSAITFAYEGMKTGLYHAMPHEAPTQPLAEALWALGCRVYLPRLQTDRLLTFRRWERDSVLQPDRLNIPSPTDSQSDINVERLDLLFIPLVGFDQNGHRLGMGGGYYDKTLAQASNAVKIGLAFDCQEVAGLPIEKHDIRLDVLITESRILRFK
jgi:5-formyltetrahydrofolate cyclo-ligase